MNFGDAFQIYLYLENRMTNRASYIGARRECYRAEKVMPFLCKACRIFPLHRSTAQVSLWREWWQRCSASLQKDIHRTFHPSGRHTWQHWSGQNADSVSPAFPYGIKKIPTVRIDRWMEKLQRTVYGKPRVLVHFLTAVSGGQVYRLVVFDLLRQISGNWSDEGVKISVSMGKNLLW